MQNMHMGSLPADVSLLDMFLGTNHGGSMGEVCILALLIGFAWLLYRRVISWRIPVAYVGTVAVLALVFFKGDNALTWMLYSVMGGGVMLGAIFMATDYATSPTLPARAAHLRHRLRRADCHRPLLRYLPGGRDLRHPDYERLRLGA